MSVTVRLIARLAIFLVSIATLEPVQADALSDHPVRPQGIRPGDTIMFVAPAGSLSRKRTELAVKRLREMGFIVRVPDNLYREDGYLAGTDQERADELMQAFTDPEVDAVFPGTGGYGVMRMLDLLDWEVIRANPKLVIGFSDITALHLAIAAKTNFISIHTPNPLWGLGSEDNLQPLAAKYFWRSILAEQNREKLGFWYDQPKELGPRVAVSKGTGQGPIIGGNLSLVSAMIGSEYEVQTDGKILFLEDIGEEPYRVDRMLAQLRLAGKLDHCAGVLLGQFTKRKSEREEGESPNWQAMQKVFEHYFAKASYPVISNFPVGHSLYNASLPMGVPAEINANNLSVQILENPVLSK